MLFTSMEWRSVVYSVWIVSNCFFNIIYFIVNFGWTSIRNQIIDQVVTSNVNGGNKIRENFQHLFSSIAKNNTKNSKNYRETLKEEAAREHQAFDVMKEQLYIAQNRNANKKRNFYMESNIIEHSVATKRETNESHCAENKRTDADNSTDSASKEQTEDESPTWENIYVYRSSSDAQGPPKVTQKMNVSRIQFLYSSIRLEKLCKRMNAAIETYKICYRKYGFNLDESMYYVDQFNEHLNDTYNVVTSLVHSQPNEISQSDLNTAMDGLDAELRRQAFDGLTQNFQLLGPSVCCGIELELLRREVQGDFVYASAECNSEAGKKARLEMMRKAKQFRKEEENRVKNATEVQNTDQ